MATPLYLDHNATTPLCPEAAEEMTRICRDFWANPSSTHKAGKRARDSLENSRERVARLLRVRPEEIVFTSGGSESNNLALKGLSDSRPGGKDHVVSTLIEHSSVHETLLSLETKGIRVTRLKPDRDGRIPPDLLAEAVTDRTFLASVIMANNEIGTIQDTEKIGQICGHRGIAFHSDGVQAVGKIPIELDRDGIGLLSVSGHKFYGPKGIGFLFKRRDIPLTALVHGGGQEGNLRSGTESPPLAAGMAVAMERAFLKMEETGRKLRILTENFFLDLKRAIPTVERNGHPDLRVSNTLNLRFPGISGPKIVSSLDDENIFVSPSSACSASSDKPSRILTALGLMADEAYSSVRFSFGPEAVEQDIPRIIAALRRAVAD